MFQKVVHTNLKNITTFVFLIFFLSSLLEKVFVHEFAKLRYGVFEEFGYPGDSQYPMLVATEE